MPHHGMFAPASPRRRERLPAALRRARHPKRVLRLAAETCQAYAGGVPATTGIAGRLVIEAMPWMCGKRCR